MGACWSGKNSDNRNNDRISASLEDSFEFPMADKLYVINRKEHLSQLSREIYGSHQLFYGNALTISKPLFASNRFAYSTSGSRSTSRSRNKNLSKSSDFHVPITEVTPQLFLGSFDDARDDKKLKKLGITHIVSLIGPVHPVQGMRIEHKPMNDFGRSNLKGVIKMLWTFIMESQKPLSKLFVHCLNGQNRSATVVLAILMNLESGPNKLKEAYNMLRKKRPTILINEKYAKQLSDMENELFGVTSVPENWMKIKSYCLENGDVSFYSSVSRTQNLSKRTTQKSTSPMLHSISFPSTPGISEENKIWHFDFERRVSSQNFYVYPDMNEVKKLSIDKRPNGFNLQPLLYNREHSPSDTYYSATTS